MVCDSHKAKTKVQPTPVQELRAKKGSRGGGEGGEGSGGAYSGLGDVSGILR